jgi:hypothetical protein
MASILGGRSRPHDPIDDDKRKRRRLAQHFPLPTPSNSAPSAPSTNTITPRASPVATTTALPELPPSPPPNAPASTTTLPQAVLAAGQIRLLSPHDLATDTLGAYAAVREAIAAATPRPGGLQALQAVLAQGPIAGER